MDLAELHLLQEHRELFIYTTEQADAKQIMFAVIKDNIVCDAWIANSLEEAQKDNPNCLVVQVTIDNSPWFIGSEYTK